MKITKVTNPELVLFLIGKAKESGLDVCGFYESYANTGDVRRYTYFKLDKTDKMIVGNTGENGGEKISIDEMMEEIKSYKYTKIKLTDQYTAVIDRDNRVVNVGCQVIPFDKVMELYEAL
jgi:hypothetical protein